MEEGSIQENWLFHHPIANKVPSPELNTLSIAQQVNRTQNGNIMFYKNIRLHNHTMT
jgi:hypothetical protein